MRSILTLVTVLSATSAIAQDGSTSPDGSILNGVAVSTSYNISAPMVAKTEPEAVLEEQNYRQQMYLLAAKECTDLLETIATSCAVSNISVSTQITRQPGVANQMYATGSVTLQVDMK